ncbi:variable large family protein (plasmid) [Borreliella turdi]|uniref:variable large family protein n=1 Tax=Borreliella turdi TaxID=57863 RepID=UPI003AF0A350
MIKAAGEAAAKGGTGDSGTSIGNATDGAEGAVADEGSVNGIAKGIRGIVDAAGKAEGKEGDALKGVEDGGNGGANADAGKLFKTDGGGAAVGDVVKAAAAVSAVSGEQILKAIVDAAGGQEQKGGNGGSRTSIGNATDGAEGAKADEESVKEIAKGIRGIVEAAGKAEGKEGNALKGVGAADAGNEEAGKLFKTHAGALGADVKAVEKAATAVSAVSGEQILKAIVDAAAGGQEQEGAAANDAKNPIAAAIGEANDNSNDFGNEMQKSDKIAAAIVLRGLAKGGKFAASNADGGKKESVKGVVDEMSAWLEEMIKAAGEAAKGGTGGGNESIGDAADNTQGAKANAESVKGIAKGIKGIVDAAGKAEGEKGNALKDVGDGGDGTANKEAGKLFKTNAGGADVAAVAKAAAAVSAVSGEQILKAIVDAAGGEDQEGKKADKATNPIAAAIGADRDNSNEFTGEMQKNDKIAAAIVLRGLAKDGKFAAAAGDEGGKKESVKGVVDEMSAWLEEMIKAAGEAAKGGTGGETSIGNADDNTAGAVADKGSVKGIAKGIKGIVEAAGKAEGEKGDALKDVEDGGAANKDAGKLFKTHGAGADVKAVAKAATAVSAVSGEQILKAIVDAAAGGKEHEGAQAANAAANSIEAAIGADGDNSDEFSVAEMQKNDKIAAAIVLRGLAKGRKFAAAAGEGGKKESVKGVVDEMSAWLEEMIKAAGEAAAGGTGDNESIGNAADDGQGKEADEGSVKGIAKGIKRIVEAAGKAEGKDGDALKGVEAAAGNGAANADAGKLFKTGAGVAVDAGDVAKAATAVSAVSGEQILKAIVDAAAAGDEGGKKESVKGVVDEMSVWLEEMIKAAGEAAKGGTGGETSIGNADDNTAGAVADKGSVKGIAKGIKGIVDAAGKAEGEKGDALKDVGAGGAANKDAGKLFKTNAGGADVKAVAKAATAVSAVSGEQILKAIVDAAAGGKEHEGAQAANAAANSIEAAIGADGDNSDEFSVAEMQKNDKIAAAIVLRGLAKGGKFAAAAGEGGKKESVKGVVDEMSVWLGEMITAAGEAAAGGTGDGTSIGNAADDGQGKEADEGSVKGIAKGIKRIVEAAGKAEGKDGDALKGVEAAAGNGAANADAGKLFKTGAGVAVDAGDVAKAATAVSAVSGEQILKAIVDAAGGGEQKGAKANEAANPIAAAIGADRDNSNEFAGEMQKNDKIAAAIVLRGLAKGGKFAAADAEGGKAVSVKGVVDEMSAWLEEMIKAAGEAAAGGTGDNESIGNTTDNQQGAKADEGSVKGIAKGIKGIVEAAGKAEGKEGDALKDVKAAADDNKDAGKLFGTQGGGLGDAAAVAKAAAAVSAVSGEQILKAIVDAAGGQDQVGAKANAAANPIAAAIGEADDAGTAFTGEMQKNDKIAAAIVLRGLAKDGKFAAANADGAKAVSVKGVVDEMSAWLEEMITAAGEAAAKGGTGNESIGNATDGAEGAKADEESVKGIAKGIKGIVDAAGKAEGKEGDALKGVGDADDNNKEAGKLFKTGGGAGDAKAVAKAATAVSAVSGEQILKAIVDAAAGKEDQEGKKAEAAANPIAAAIGAAQDNGAFWIFKITIL